MVDFAVAKWVLCGASASGWSHTSLGHKEKTGACYIPNQFEHLCGQIPDKWKRGGCVTGFRVLVSHCVKGNVWYSVSGILPRVSSGCVYSYETRVCFLHKKFIFLQTHFFPPKDNFIFCKIYILHWILVLHGNFLIVTKCHTV